jgi:hypothetical protein
MCVKYNGLDLRVIKLAEKALGFTCQLGKANSTATPDGDKQMPLSLYHLLPLLSAVSQGD